MITDSQRSAILDHPLTQEFTSLQKQAAQLTPPDFYQLTAIGERIADIEFEVSANLCVPTEAVYVVLRES